VKNVTFTVGPKNGAFVNARLGSLHHSAESRMGLLEGVIACVIVAALASFAFVLVH
jgi:hypothetical protein